MSRVNEQSLIYGFGCGIMTVMFTIYAIAATFAFEYVLKCVLDKDIPWYADLVAGILCGGVMLPATVVCWIMQLCGVQAPFIQ